MAILGSFLALGEQAPHTPGFQKALAYARELLAPGGEAARRLRALQPGQSHRVELGDGVHVIEQVYLTRAREEGRWESHRVHADVQLLVEGEEIIAAADAPGLARDEDLTPAQDVVFYRSHAGGSALRLGPGEGAILLPSDAHLGGLRTGPAAALVRKSVVKVPLASAGAAPGPRLASVCPVLVSPDVRRTVRFYTELLGFRYAEHLDKAERFATVYRDGIELVIVEAARGAVEPNRARHGVGQDAYVVMETVAGVDALHAELAARGVRILEPPHLTDYRSREFCFEDCDGRAVGVGRIADPDHYFARSNVR